MQETIYKDDNGEDKIHQEFFSAKTEVILFKNMRKRLKALETKGHTFVRRVKIRVNDPCPCGSGKKYKKCCIHKERGVK